MIARLALHASSVTVGEFRKGSSGWKRQAVQRQPVRWGDAPAALLAGQVSGTYASLCAAGRPRGMHLA